MTRAKALAAMFRSINIDLGYLGIPMVVCNHVYLEQGSMYPQEILKGGKALVYSSSVIGMMSKAKLKTQEEDEMDLGASGIVVTFKTAKNRLAKPKKIKFEISFIHGMNPYTGLDAFCRPGEITFKPGGNRWFVRHLDKSVTTKQLFSPTVFTDEVLQRMAPIVNGYFKYKSFDEMQEFEEEFAQLEEAMDDFRDISDADELFG
ncbi:MAG: hypothetical protein EBY07_17075 [Actinobacteria bacterium]|nr:hypothetical protein [Actinomycetota bacterium]